MYVYVSVFSYMYICVYIYMYMSLNPQPYPRWHAAGAGTPSRQHSGFRVCSVGFDIQQRPHPECTLLVTSNYQTLYP